MTSLEKVLTAVQANSEVALYQTIPRNFMPRRDGYWSQTVTIIVYPHKGIYTAQELNDLMDSLVPEGMKPTSRDAARDGGSSLEFGKLYFDEVIGTETHNIVLDDQSWFNKDGNYGADFFHKTTTWDEELKRRTWVLVYPDKVVTELIYPPSGVEVEDPTWSISEYRIEKEALKSLQPNLDTKVLSF
jgi:hypothetical protein